MNLTAGTFMLLASYALLASGCGETCSPTVGFCADGSCEASWFCGNNDSSYAVRVAADGTCACVQNGEVTSNACDASSMCDVITTAAEGAIAEGTGAFEGLDDAVDAVCGFSIRSVDPIIIASCGPNP